MSGNDISQEQFLNEPWRIRIQQKGGQFLLWNEDLRLRGRGTDLNSAHNDLIQQTKQYWSEMKDYGLLDQTPRKNRFQWRDLFQREADFFIRHLLLGVFYIVIFLGMMGALVKQIDKSVDRIAAEYSKSTANPNTPEGQKRLEKFTDDLQNLKPYVREVKKMWNETN